MIAKDLDIAADFPPVSYEQWRENAEAELKGAPFEKKLVGRTFEGIDIQPLYGAQHWRSAGDASGFPGLSPLTRGDRVLGNAAAGWDIRQEHLHPDPAEANRAILDDLEHGVSSIQLRLDAAACSGLDADDRDAVSLAGQDGVMAYSVGDLDRVLDGVRLDIAPVSIDCGGSFLPGAALLAALLEARGVEPSGVRCAFNADPIGALMRDGRLNVPLDEAMAELADLACWTADRYPEATSVEVGTGAYHHAGASSTQDLAFAVATGLEYLRAMTAAGLDVNAAARQIAFGVSLGTQFFRAIAKLRALRLMWSKVVLECGGDPDAGRTMRLRARTSRRVLTGVDPWVNLLRNTVCCFAGAVGGADSITTAPMDAALGLSDHFARHLARNTQIILQEESHLNRVIDPAGGSWFLETLTGQLAERSWEILRQVEERGGMIPAATGGWVGDQVEEVEAAREEAIATRKLVVTGVTEHPDVREERLVRERPDYARLRAEASTRLVSWRRDHKGGEAFRALAESAVDADRSPGSLTAAAIRAARGGATIGQMASALASASGGREPARVAPLAVHPYAAAFEELRAAADIQAQEVGRRPRVFLANLGIPAEFIARSTYAANFFQAGGFEEVNNDGFPDPRAAAEAFARSGAAIAVICSTDARYQEQAEPLARELKASGARTVVLAGNPGANEARYRAAGVDRFIFIRCDVLGTLRDLLREEGALR
ncbi:methylmalonyl-CoA mutase family protein [Tautonia plasticadhaerens]|uniref:Methylmalonyl-CoA mutase n=1 Tax=Tautonia plasticadhaerens TaxID=2527974 RepID=A0A518H5J6_9BACT|nr:methylmalonyl-CoA mutase family protein [Tautonia plasticadhaerens]QDV36088.1 Methylmalonyl-CoA mutase [Tautonia plasticadhaerens]